MKLDLPNWRLTLVDGLDGDTPEAFLDWVEGLDGLVSIDTETWGLAWWDRDFTRLVTFADDHRGYAVPVRWWGKTIEQALSRIRDKGVPVGYWNATFDQHALDSDDFPTPHWHNCHDGRVMHHLLYPHHDHRLKASSAVELGKWAETGRGWLEAKARELGYGREWWAVPVDLKQYWMYGILDTLLTQQMIRRLGPRMRSAGLAAAYEREMAVSAIMWRAERRGMRIDHKYAEKLRREWLSRAVELKDYLHGQGVENPNSNRQLEQLFRELGWRPEDFTDTGQAVLDKVVLGELSQTYPKVAPHIIEYKRLTKWIGAYLDPFVESGGRVHPSINTLRAKTGRMSITSPALQTLPSRGSAGAIRRCVLPEPGHELWAIDYDGQEARIFASLSGDPGMSAAYEAGDDLYTHVARIVYDDSSITREDPRRNRTKTTFLAFTYGAGAEKLAFASGQSVVEVERFLATLFRRFPTVRDMTGDHAIGGNYPGKPALLAEQRLASEGLAYVKTRGGRRFSMPDGEFYKAINGLCQGSGADVLKDAIVRLDRAGLSQYIVVPVHDEVVFSIPKEEHELAAEAATCLEDRSWPIPLTVETTGPLPHWGAAYGYEEG